MAKKKTNEEINTAEETTAADVNYEELLAEKDVNIEYMYGLSIDGEEASVVLKTSDLEKAEELLAEKGVATLSAEEISNM